MIAEPAFPRQESPAEAGPQSWRIQLAHRGNKYTNLLNANES